MPEYKSPQSEPGTEQRFLLVFLLMAVVIFASQFFMKKYMPQQPASTAKPVEQPIQAPASAGTPAASSGDARGSKNNASTSMGGNVSAAKNISSASAASAAKAASAESETVVENDLYKITFSNRGAQVKSWILKKFNDDQGRPLDLVHQAASARYGYTLSLWTYVEPLRNKLSSVLYVSSAEGNLSAPASLTFEHAEAGLNVRKVFQFDQSYVVKVDTSVFANDAPVSAFPAWPSGFGDQTTLPAFASGQFEYQVNSDTEHPAVKKISGGNTLHGTYDWAGISGSYFSAVF